MARSWAVESLTEAEAPAPAVTAPNNIELYEGKSDFEVSQLEQAENIHEVSMLTKDTDAAINDLNDINDMSVIATEALRFGGLSATAALSLESRMNRICNRWGFEKQTFGCENQEADPLEGTKGIIGRLKANYKRLRDTVTGFLRTRWNKLRQYYLDSLNHGIKAKKALTSLRPMVDGIKGLESSVGLDISVASNPNLLKLNYDSVWDPEASLNLANCAMDIAQIGKRFQALFAIDDIRPVDTNSEYGSEYEFEGGFYTVDPNDPTINFLRPIAKATAEAFFYAMPWGSDNGVSPFIGYALPGSVFVASAKTRDGIILTDYTPGGYISAYDETPATVKPLSGKDAMRYLNGGFALAEILQARMNDFIKNSKEVLDAVEQLKVLEDTSDDYTLLRQARANIDAAYITVMALTCALTNSVDGITEYITQSCLAYKGTH